ncbi:MAG: Ig-like domain-containing protein [Candidatus Poribacteria bacterium]|nr:Ig-like domain-containing protein [Candidatus Poribacteria bacterium]
MKKPRNIAVLAILTIVCAWMVGCGGCNPEPVPSGMNPTQGPETGGTTVQITGEKFDMKNGVTVTFGGKNATSVTVPSETQITAVTPGGMAGESVSVVITNKGKPEVPVTLSQQFTYTDATPPTVTMNEPADGTVISEYEDSLNVMNSVSVSFSEAVNSDSVSISVAVAKTEDSMSEPMDATLAGTVSGTGDSVMFTSDMPMRAGRMYTVTVSGATDMAGNALVSPHSFSFSVTSPEKLDRYHVQEEDVQEENGEAALKRIAARPEIYDNPEMWKRLVAGNQDDYIFDRTKLSVGQFLWIRRGPAWGDK